MAPAEFHGSEAFRTLGKQVLPSLEGLNFMVYLSLLLSSWCACLPYLLPAVVGSWSVTTALLLSGCLCNPSELLLCWYSDAEVTAHWYLLVFQSKVGGGGRRRGGQRHKVKSQGACVTPASGCWISYTSSLWGIPPLPFISYPKDPEQLKPKPIPADWLQKNRPSSLKEAMERSIIYKLMKVIRHTELSNWHLPPPPIDTFLYIMGLVFILISFYYILCAWRREESLDRTAKSQLAASLLPHPILSTGLAALLLFAVSDPGVINHL